MKIVTENLGKKYKTDWIFRNFNHTFQSDNIYAITGPNGSGKSTLLQVLAGFVLQNTGNTLYYNEQNIEVPVEKIYKNIAIASPFLEIIEDFTLAELIDFQGNMKPYNIPSSQIPTWLELEKHRDKQLKYFSSGMRQKVKLGLCMASSSNILLLDEPTSNFDHNTKNWYQSQLQNLRHQKIVIIASNDPAEYQQANSEINILNFK
jgi:ABC-type multidrug transport system ATPase subunit